MESPRRACGGVPVPICSLEPTLDAKAPGPHRCSADLLGEPLTISLKVCLYHHKLALFHGTSETEQPNNQGTGSTTLFLGAASPFLLNCARTGTRAPLWNKDTPPGYTNRELHARPPSLSRSP